LVQNRGEGGGYRMRRRGICVQLYRVGGGSPLSSSEGGEGEEGDVRVGTVPKRI
jgi:hypothetical protein